MTRCLLFAGALWLSACTGEFGALTPPIELGAADRGVQESCGDAVDNDGDGEVDEDCACEPGAAQSCYAGPAGTDGVGACRVGEQACEDHFEFPSWGPCVGSVGPTDEVADNGLDDDCDGVVDRPDETSPCPAGLTETYRPRYPSDPLGGSSIEHGDGGTSMDVSCEEVPCGPGQVAVEEITLDYSEYDEDGFDWTEATTSALICVAAPPVCPDGTSPSYRSPVQLDDGSGFDVRGGEEDPDSIGVQSGWRCDPPCDLIVHYGAAFGSLAVCTLEPELACAGDEVPTFVFETESWACAPLCDNGLYDQIWLEEVVLCVPC